jgi:hypothetical protein
MPADVRRHDDRSPPPEWMVLLTVDEWLLAVHVLGEDRLAELHALMSALSTSFRSSFVAHLSDLGGLAAGQAVLLALARATHDADHRARPCATEEGIA